jgi:hypothetical protein
VTFAIIARSNPGPAAMVDRAYRFSPVWPLADLSDELRGLPAVLAILPSCASVSAPSQCCALFY